MQRTWRKITWREITWRVLCGYEDKLHDAVSALHINLYLRACYISFLLIFLSFSGQFSSGQLQYELFIVQNVLYNEVTGMSQDALRMSDDALKIYI